MNLRCSVGGLARSYRDVARALVPAASTLVSTLGGAGAIRGRIYERVYLVKEAAWTSER